MRKWREKKRNKLNYCKLNRQQIELGDSMDRKLKIDTKSMKKTIKRTYHTQICSFNL